MLGAIKESIEFEDDCENYKVVESLPNYTPLAGWSEQPHFKECCEIISNLAYFGKKV